MKLPLPAQPQSVAEKLAEFDIWITPTLGEIRDTPRFQQELQKIVDVFETLAHATHDFASVDSCSPDAITDARLSLVKGREPASAYSTLHGAAALLYLSTGKSDNNIKCQLPLHLRDAAKWATFPAFGRKKGQRVLKAGKMPRTLKADKYVEVVAALSEHADEQRKLLYEFVRFLLSDRTYVEQLWCIGSGYVALKRQGHERQFLTPLVVFQVRGSVSASGGHEPERRLRLRLDEWGLLDGVDYNVTDVKILPGVGAVEAPDADDVAVAVDGDEAEADEDAAEAKTRAYDFVLPYKTDGWKQSVFIQSQFYAGDSGSVSHKNLDQVKTSRPTVLAQNKDAYFIEYVDGAGYFASLKGDLKKLFQMRETTSFAQVRSTPLRVRRAWQEIGFLTPLEVEHAIVRTASGDEKEVVRLLAADGYEEAEVDRCIRAAIGRNLISRDGTRLAIRADRRDTARRYALLDTVAIHGVTIEPLMGSPTGYMMVPGYGPFYGIKLDELLVQATSTVPGFAAEWQTTQVWVEDTKWLVENRFAVQT